MARVVYKKYNLNSQGDYEIKENRTRRISSPPSGSAAYSSYNFDRTTGLFTLTGAKDYMWGGATLYSATGSNPTNEFYQFFDGKHSSTYYSERIVSRGSYIGEVTAEDGTYPRSGESGGYWYEWDRLANRAPTITGSTTLIGNVNEDFNFSYRVSDADGDTVRVQIMVDNKVIQYPMAVALDRTQTVNIRLADYTLGDHKIVVTATDSSNASASRTYSFRKTNQPPVISGSDLDLGGKYEDFSVDYVVQDADGNTVKVEVKLDGVTKQAPTATTLGVRKFYTIPIKDVKLGKHTIEIIATDTYGAKDTRTFTFQKVNNAPEISGQDEHLGAKNTGFSYSYTVKDIEGDKITVHEKINGKIVNTIENITLGQSQTMTITDEQIQGFDLDGLNTIEISATDGTATTYRRITFVRNNMPPIIADKDKDLGNVTSSLTYKWSATDPEKDKMTATIYLDDKVYKKRHAINEGAGQTFSLKGLDMFKIKPGKHNLKIVVEDDKGFLATRKLTFTRVVKRLIMQLANKGIETDELAKRVNPADAGIYVARGAGVKYEVCNNSFDAKPTWEDATDMVQDGRAYVFQNQTKTAEKAGVNIRVTINKNTATALSYITAIGGSFD